MYGRIGVFYTHIYENTHESDTHIYMYILHVHPYSNKRKAQTHMSHTHIIKWAHTSYITHHTYNPRAHKRIKKKNQLDCQIRLES